MKWTYDKYNKVWCCSRGAVFKDSDGWLVTPAIHNRNAHYGPFPTKAEAIAEAERVFQLPEHAEDVWTVYL